METTQNERNLIGSFPIYHDKRDHSNFKIFWELVKKLFLVRIRSPSSLVETLFAFIFFLVIVPVDKLTSSDIPSIENPLPQYDTNIIPLDIAYFFLSSNLTRVVAAPKTIPVMSLMNYLYSNFLKYTSLKVEYVDDEREISKRIEKFDVNGFGLFWENSEKNDSLTHPVIRTYLQCVYSCPTNSLLRMIRSHLANELIKNYPNNDEISKLIFINSSIQEFASPKFRKYKLRSQFPLMFIGSVLVLSTMPDCETLTHEKYTKLSSLYFLMGCSETIYYLSFYFVSFVCSSIPCLAMSLFYCYYYFMTSVSFTLYLTVNLLFSLSFISLTLFCSVLFRSAKIARFYSPFMFIFNIISVLLVSFNFDIYWRSSITTNKFFFVVPQFSYLLTICALRMNSLYQNIHIGWSNLAQPELNFNITNGLISLAIDSILYAFLFAISYIISKHSSLILKKIKSLFRKNKNFQNSFNENDVPLYDVNDNNNNNFFVRVTELSKLYKQLDKKSIFDKINDPDSEDKRALKSVSFDVKKNEIIVVTGPNGAGKTTLINILSGIIKPSYGHLELNQSFLELNNESFNFNQELKPTALEGDSDNSLSNYLIEKNQNPTFPESGCFRTEDFSLLQPYMGVVFQENVFVCYLSVRENLIFFGTLRGISKRDIFNFIDFFCTTLQMKDSLFKLAKDLSGGQKRKLCLAISLIGNPSILLLDEPTSGVDVQGRQLIWKMISSLNTTAIITTHGLEEAEAASSRIFIINKGKIPFTGNSAELREKFKCGYMIKFDNGSIAAHDAMAIMQNEVLAKKGMNPEMVSIKNDFLDTVYIPICPEVTECLEEIEKRKEEMNIGDYSIFIEQLEDLILSSEREI